MAIKTEAKSIASYNKSYDSYKIFQNIQEAVTRLRNTNAPDAILKPYEKALERAKRRVELTELRRERARISFSE